MSTALTPPSPIRTLAAVAKGYLPRLIQPRGWILAALTMTPVLLALGLQAVVMPFGGTSATFGLQLFHQVTVSLVLPILALVAAPGGIREDLEQRTLPLLLVRPAAVWIYPVAKALPWYAWGTFWLTLSTLGLPALGADATDLGRLSLTLALAFWAQLAVATALGLFFKRGILWGALWFFAWDPLVRVFPGNLQRFTFLHYIESLAGSRGGRVTTSQILAQEPITTPFFLAVLALLAIGLAAWALSGWRLHRTPIGLAGSEGEG